MSSGASAAPACPEESELLSYLEGDEHRRAEIQRHLDHCDACRELVAALVREHAPEAEGPALLPRGATLGRYVVVDAVGRGAMGVVYRAFDPDLDRRVAVKVLRPDGAHDASRDARLLAEAQAMAKLSHPNVITVFDVGVAEGAVFLAMEFVRGTTLRAAGGSWRQRFSLYLQAGEGLAAAHAAGVVHRDFKPDNVLVGEDGRARVTDFGLASHDRSVLPEGMKLGTPAYMAPEQARGEAGDARADQFSFCVALHEALYGGRPGEATTTDAKIPPRLRRVILRGCSAEPAARWPSMRALLTALSAAATIWTPQRLVTLSLLGLFALGAWGNHFVLERRVRAELANAAQLLPRLLAHPHELAVTHARVALGAGPVLAAFAGASDLDAALGLAPKSEEAQQLTEAHEVLRSADLPGLRTGDLLVLMNGWGEVIYDRADEQSFGQVAPGLPILVRAMNGTPSAELWPLAKLRQFPMPLLDARDEAPLYFVSALPVLRGQSLSGAVLTGVGIRAAQLAEWERALGARLVLATQDGASSDARFSSEIPWAAGVRVVRSHGQALAVLGVPVALPGADSPGVLASLSLPLDELHGWPPALAPALRWSLLAGFLIALAAALRRLLGPFSSTLPGHPERSSSGAKSKGQNV